MIYDGSPAKHLGQLAALIVGKLLAKNRCLYLNSPAMVAGLRSYLAADGVDVEREITEGSLILSSDLSHLANGVFDVERMLGMLNNAVTQALNDGYDGMWTTGDMTWEFGNEQNLGKLLEYECGLEELFRQQPALCGICQYHTGTLPFVAIKDGLCTHEAIYVNGTISRINPYYALHGAPASLSRQRPDLVISSLEALLHRLQRQTVL